MPALPSLGSNSPDEAFFPHTRPMSARVMPESGTTSRLSAMRTPRVRACVTIAIRRGCAIRQSEDTAAPDVGLAVPTGRLARGRVDRRLATAALTRAICEIPSGTRFPVSSLCGPGRFFRRRAGSHHANPSACSACQLARERSAYPCDARPCCCLRHQPCHRSA